MSRWGVLVALAILGGACEYDDLACEPGDSVYIEHVDHAWSEYSDADTYRNPIDLAAGGTERFEVHIVHGCGETSPASPIASLTATGAVVVTQVGPTTFEVQAISEGGSSIQIVTESGLAGALTIRAERVASVALVTDELGRPDGFVLGTPSAKILLLSAEDQPLVDRRLTVAGPLPRTAVWNELALSAAAVGDTEIRVLGGDSGWPLTVHVVDGIDQLVAEASALDVPSYRSEAVCFHALRDGGEISGVPWELEFDHAAGTIGSHPNCVTVWKGVDRPAAMVITARALGLAASTTVTFID